MASWHCHQESFLRETLEIALGRFGTVWKVSRWSGKLPDDLKIFLMVQKVYGFPGNFSDFLESFQMVCILFG